MDRIDLFVELQRPPARKYQSSKPQESSASIRKQIHTARQIQQKRFNGTPIKTNSEMIPKQIQKQCPLTVSCQNLLVEAADNLKLSGRQYHQTIKIARTIADLNSQTKITPENIAEALQYRKKTTSYSR
jgi:magnesium chelatase family protein